MAARSSSGREMVLVGVVGEVMAEARKGECSRRSWCALREVEEAGGPTVRVMMGDLR